jgi:hypothetical protein
MLQRRGLALLARTRLTQPSKYLPRKWPPLRPMATAVPPSPHDNFATGGNAYYVDEMYRHWREDPKSVHASWDAYFSGMENGLPSEDAFQPPPGLLNIPHPADGAPSMHLHGGQELTDHLKARSFSLISSESGLHNTVVGPIACQSVPSSRTSRCRPRSSWCSGR